MHASMHHMMPACITDASMHHIEPNLPIGNWATFRYLSMHLTCGARALASCRREPMREPSEPAARYPWRARRRVSASMLSPAAAPPPEAMCRVAAKDAEEIGARQHPRSTQQLFSALGRRSETVQPEAQEHCKTRPHAKWLMSEDRTGLPR